MFLHRCHGVEIILWNRIVAKTDPLVERLIEFEGFSFSFTLRPRTEVQNGFSYQITPKPIRSPPTT